MIMKIAQRFALSRLLWSLLSNCTVGTEARASAESCAALYRECSANAAAVQCCAPASCVVINSYYSQCLLGATGRPSPSPTTHMPTAAPRNSTGGSSKCSGAYQQCRGNGYTGPTCCKGGHVCTLKHDSYYQCVPKRSAAPTWAPPPTPTVGPSPKPTTSTTAKPTSKLTATPTVKATVKPTANATSPPSCGLLTAEPLPGFQITLFNSNKPCDNTFDRYFWAAAAKWESMITGDLTSYGPNIVDNWFPPASYVGTKLVDFGQFSGGVDDVIISFQYGAIDGAGSATTGLNILGTSGPYRYRDLSPGATRPFGTTVSGVMLFDSYDMAGLAADGRLLDVITHEMGHVLGIGTLWGNCSQCVANDHSADYKCAQGQQRFVMAGFVSPSHLQIETGLGQGSACSHWDEDTMGNELMTPVIASTGKPNPLSAVTLGALADIGYQGINFTKADLFTAASSPASHRRSRKMAATRTSASNPPVPVDSQALGKKSVATVPPLGEVVLPFYQADSEAAFRMSPDGICGSHGICPQPL